MGGEESLGTPAFAEGTVGNPAPPTSFIGRDRADLASAFAALGLESFRVAQTWGGVYDRGLQDWNALTTLAKPVRALLTERFSLARPRVVTEQVSTDGTRKWLLALEDGQFIETVFIPEEDRGTLCVSSQVGCTLTCRFCHTGTQRLTRNLTAGEIVGQVLAARDALDDWPSTRETRKISNLVLMGMGEPLFNYDNVAKAVRIIMDGSGLALGKRKVTLSTSGVVPLIERCGRELGVNLAISLHAVTDAVRDTIMPINRKYPIRALLAACRTYPGISNARRITFEYIMLKGINDSPDDARALVRLLSGIPAKINLIPFNAWPGSPFEPSDDATVARFAAIIHRAGYASPVRAPRGRDILAACGQLKSARASEATGCEDVV